MVDTLAASNVGYFTYLSPSQALADFAALISYLNPNHDRSVIAFGGSYGGMLSSWMRLKYSGREYLFWTSLDYEC